MANRFFNPNEQFCDNTGTPYAGGSLAFYASGTSTPLNTYSDSALTIANLNPVVLDSAGRAGSIFLQNLAYKVVLTDVNSNLIGTYDPVYASDYSTRAKLTTGSGSPNGNTAGTAGSAGIGADTYWDASNNILYVCTTTGNAAGAVWTAVNATTAAAVVPAPQGYLTPTSGTPIISSDVTGSSSLVYTPYVGNIVPIYTGSGFSPTTFSELTLTLSASQAANTIYDVFVFNNSSILTLVTGPAWTTSTAGSGARGTGASTTQISRLGGFWVNAVQISGKNGASTYAIPANQATYLGSIYIDATPGQVTCQVSWGFNRKWGIWNAYNRAQIQIKSGDATNYAYITNTLRAVRGGANTVVTTFAGLAEEPLNLNYVANLNGVTLTTNQTTGGLVAIGYNSTSVASGREGQVSFTNSTASAIVYGPGSVWAHYLAPPSLGINTITALENGLGVTANSWNGAGELQQVLSAQWRG